MSVPLILTFVSTVVFAIQFLIVVDLYNHISALIRDNPRAGPAPTETSPPSRRCPVLFLTASRGIQSSRSGPARLPLEVTAPNASGAPGAAVCGTACPPH